MTVGIVRRDLKPRNILITGTALVAKLSDVGIIKRQRIYRFPICGSSVWLVPELFRHDGCVSPAIDVFSLGCVLFFCIARGRHPFGERLERDANIEDNTMDLSSVEFIPEAHDLILRLLNADPKLRPQASKVLDHPFFWSSEKRLSFLRDICNRVELEAGAPNSRLLQELEKTAPTVFGESWDGKIEARVMDNLRRYGAYDGTRVRDLLQAVRDNFSHHKKAPKRVKKTFGSVPEGLDAYFAVRYPALLIESYRVLGQFCKKEKGFWEYFRSLSSAKRGRLLEVLTKSKRLKTR
ncbi:serine/threonine-protein kinase/endoribonuclease IRE1a-like [Rhodamnia argentea]|uniref:Serine/threonine-protein kinase/endoribonuclease IRE1a-like n=1 Tax=Rhodamnia argentea TaxID=178133 RepID=A0A8B8P7W0_9MYRT|nr:serine/threonine-protein kinase/endoribonuclease IRE1a-like [Rhodamnia argentea]XP_048140644.1 serine/threonine-protein kinase/endoribonuclease IRE1a-like [Rhodamnia argentea]